MNLYRLGYYSRVAKNLRKEDLKQILASSVVNNQIAGVSGALVFSKDIFLQVLEGHRDSINSTLRRINSDPRHTHIALLGLVPITERAFEQWAMAYIDDSKITQTLLLKHCKADKLVAEYFSLDNTLAFIKDAMG